MLRRLGVRGKILATLAVPIFVLVLAATYISWSALQDATEARQTSALVDSLDLQDAAGTAVAQERGLAMAMLNGVPDLEDRMTAAQEQSDLAVDARNAALRELDTSALSLNVREAISATLADREVLDSLQERVMVEGQISETSASTQYTEIIERALDLPRAVSASAEDSGLSEHLNAYITMDEAMLANTYERPLIALTIADVAQAVQRDEDNPEFNTQLTQRVVQAIKQTDSARLEAQNRLEDLGMGDLPALSEEFNDLRFKLEFWNPTGIDPAVAAQPSELSQAWIDAMQPLRDDVRAETVGYASDLSSNARNQAIGTMLTTFGVVLLSLVIALVIARRIVMPLRRLTSATAEVRHRLPQMVEQMAVPGQSPDIDLVKIPVESSDEIGRLANAFNEVNATTMEVAQEQAALRGSIAEMFVNVARRDQVLLNRQLAFLDDLERSEEDPSTLSNLFRLDHLATRMRRNAESLLVLAGIDSGRRVRNPMPVSDVIRTASSEIELYDRVRLNLMVDPQMLGHNALNAAHLLAELLENATMFSEPHTPVEVTTTRDARGVVVAVRDHGLGMSAQEIADANVKVASSAASDAVGAQRLGLYVVGRLAARLGARVEFGTGVEGKGTLVTVVFPGDLFLADDALPLPQPTDPLEATTQRSVAALAAPVADTSVPLPTEAPTPDRVEAPAPASEPVPVASAAEAPAPVRTPVFEPEPPVVEAVDLDALTDGTTSTGMPRRRRAETETPTEAIVLPPLETPQLDDSVPAEVEAGWSPPSEVAAGSSLPSRQRSAPASAEPLATSGSMPLVAPDVESPLASLGVEQRTGLFSSFRSMERLDDDPSASTLQLDAVTDDPADLPVGLGSTPEAPQEPEAPQASAVVPEPEVASVPTPVVSSVPAPEPVADHEPLPAFEDLMSDLPSRRADGPASNGNRKRGLFGRKPAVDSVDAAATAAADSVTGGSAPVPSVPGDRDDLLGRRSLPDDAPSWAADVPAQREVPSAGPVRQEPAPEPVPFASWGSPKAVDAPLTEPSPVADLVPAVEEVPYLPQPAEPEPAAEPVRERRAEPAAGATGYGESVLPLRSTSGRPDDPLDPHYVPDTVEARSEWMASAVLYEEMSTLLQRGVFQEGNVTASNPEPTYQPTSLSPTSPGLIRRSRGGEPAAPSDRFTARIERDPEQLRARLSAFQSATARGRSDVSDAGASTNGALTMNDVHGTAPHQR